LLDETKARGCIKMKVFNYSEARQNFTTVLNTALKEEVIIARKDGSRFKLVSIQENKQKEKSPLEDIKGIKANIAMDDIIDAIRESRER
jgi:hypothetical protein